MNLSYGVCKINDCTSLVYASIESRAKLTGIFFYVLNSSLTRETPEIPPKIPYSWHRTTEIHVVSMISHCLVMDFNIQVMQSETLHRSLLVDLCRLCGMFWILLFTCIISSVIIDLILSSR